MPSQATYKLHTIDNGFPEVEVLWNGRYRLTFLCQIANKRTGWFRQNIEKVLPEYGTAMGASFSGDAWQLADGVEYEDLLLVKKGTPYINSTGTHLASLTYETLTGAWVAEKDEDTDYELNGLKRVTRTFVALPDTEYSKVVGTSTIDSNGTTLTLGSFSVKETDSKWELTEVWLESGELSRSENLEDGKESVSITQIGGCPSAPSGYTVVNENKDNTQGFETCARTFYKDDSVLSRSNDYVGSQLAEVIEVFNPSGQPTPTNGSAVLGSKSQSNVDGIPTTRYTFLVPSILSESEDKVGSQKAITIEAFNETPATPIGYVIANKQDSDVEGIPTKRYTFLKPSILSRSEDKIGSQKAITIEAFSETPSTPSGYNLANTQESDYEGIKTSRYTFLKDDAELSRSEDLIGSQLAIVIEQFNGTPATPSGYSLANTQVSDVEGVPTKRYTFLKPSILSTRINERNGGIGTSGAIRTEVIEAFNLIPTSTIGGVQIGDEVSNVDGIPTRRYTFASGSGQIRVSTMPAPASLAGTNYVTVESVGAEILPPGVLVESSDINDDGFIRYVRTSLQGTIVGVKTTYKDVADVRVAGTVDLVGLSKTTGGISGTIAVADVTPPRTKSIAATVTIEITTTPPDTVSIAYDLGDTSCSVTSISMSENFRGTDVFTTSSGNSRYSGQRKTADMSARISTYPECYLSGLTSNSGTFSYTSSYENQSTDPNSIVAIGQVSTTNTFVDGTGSTSAGYATTGVIKRNSRAILTAIDGTVYYEVITWTV